MTPADLDALARAATPGPYDRIGTIVMITGEIGSVCQCRYVSDANYIAALSPERVLAMIAVIEAAKAMRDKRDVEVVTDPRVLAFDAALAALEKEQK